MQSEMNEGEEEIRPPSPRTQYIANSLASTPLEFFSTACQHPLIAPSRRTYPFRTVQMARAEVIKAAAEEEDDDLDSSNEDDFVDSDGEEIPIKKAKRFDQMSKEELAKNLARMNEEQRKEEARLQPRIDAEVAKLNLLEQRVQPRGIIRAGYKKNDPTQDRIYYVEVDFADGRKELIDVDFVKQHAHHLLDDFLEAEAGKAKDRRLKKYGQGFEAWFARQGGQ